MDSYKLKKTALIIVIVLINIILTSMVSINVMKSITKQLKVEIQLQF